MTNKVDFMNHLKLFLTRIGKSFNRIPRVGGVEVDFHLLYKLVTERKGFDECMKLGKMKWREVITNYQRNVTIPKACTNLSYILREKYKTFLLAYERAYYNKEGEEKKKPKKRKTRQNESLIILKRAKKHDLPEQEKTNVLPFVKRKKLYLSKNQLDLVKRIECCLTARNNFQQIDWALNTLLSLCSNFEKNNFSLLLIDHINVLETITIIVREHVQLLREERNQQPLNFATTSSSSSSSIPPPPPPLLLPPPSRIFHDNTLMRRRAMEKRSFVSLNIIRLLSSNPKNLPFFLAKMDISSNSGGCGDMNISELTEKISLFEYLIAILEKLQSITPSLRLDKLEEEEEEDGIELIHSNLKSSVLGIFENLSLEISFSGNQYLSTLVGIRFLTVIQNVFLSPSFSNEMDRNTIQILYILNNLFRKNELLYERHLSEDRNLPFLELLISQLSTEIGPFKNDHICRTLTLELLHKFVVSSLMMSKKFKKRLVRVNGLIPRLIQLVKLKSRIDGEDISTYDSVLREEKKEGKKKKKRKGGGVNESYIPRPPGDYFQMMCVSVIKYYAKKRTSSVVKYLGEFKVCASVAEDENVVKELMGIINSIEKKQDKKKKKKKRKNV